MRQTRYGAKKSLTYKTAATLRDALAALNLPDGITRPYRPKPADFRETYVRMGWDGIEDHFGTNWRVIRRWIEMEGREGLIAERAAYVEEQRADRRAQRRRVA